MFQIWDGIRRNAGKETFAADTVISVNMRSPGICVLYCCISYSSIAVCKKSVQRSESRFSVRFISNKASLSSRTEKYETDSNPILCEKYMR